MLDYSKGKWRRVSAARVSEPGALEPGKPVTLIQAIAKGGQKFNTIAEVTQQPDTKSPEAGRTLGNARLLAGAADMYKALRVIAGLLSGDSKAPDAARNLAENTLGEVERG